MRVKTKIDFFAVDHKHREIHQRLENWARSLRSGVGGGTSPMFRLYRPDNYGRESGGSGIFVLQGDAMKIAKGVQFLPIPHRAALNWCYVKPTNPRKACQMIGCSMDHLMQLIRDGRQMLVNRGI